MKILIYVVIVAILIVGCTTKKKAKKEATTLPNFDAMWDYQNPQETETKFIELMPIAKESGDTSYYIELLTQIARTQGLQGKFEEAHATLDTTLSLLSDELKQAKVRYLLERGRVFNSSGNPEKSKPLFIEAFEIAKVNKLDLYAIDAAHMMGIVEHPEKQLEWSLKALEITEKTIDKKAKRWLGPLYNNIGWTYNDLKEYDKALTLFEKGLKWREEINDEQGIRIQTWNIARTYRSLGKIAEALEMQRALEKEYEEKGIEQDGYVFEEIGECLLLLNKNEEAKPYFAKAYEYLSKDNWLVDNESERLERLKELSE